MKATGIIRRIDDLGRVVIPREIRRTMGIREGDPLEIYTGQRGEVIFKKYAPTHEKECAAILKGLLFSVKSIEGVGKVAIYGIDDTLIDGNDITFPTVLHERADICEEFKWYEEVYTIVGSDIIGYLVVEYNQPVISSFVANTQAILRELDY